jgi:hypothetical protein
VLDIHPERMMPAHGPVIGEPGPLLRSYLQHRREREDQIFAALRAGASTPAAIVARVYEGLKESLAPLAAESVKAHLVKLEQEGRARRQDETWEAAETRD